MSEGIHSSGPPWPRARDSVTDREIDPDAARADDEALEEAPEETPAERDGVLALDRAERLVAFTAALAQTWTSDRVAASAIEQGRIAARALDVSLWLVDGPRNVARLEEATHDAEVRRRFAELPLDEARRFPVVDAIRAAKPVWLESRAALHEAYPALGESAG